MEEVNNEKKKFYNVKGINPVRKSVKSQGECPRTKRTHLRIAGKEHRNTKGELVSARKPGPDCNCRRQCYEKVPEKVRLKIFKGYYSMKTHDEQNAYLFGLIRQVDILRKTKQDSNRRTCTYLYFVRIKGREQRVCQTAFKNIHGITEKKIRVLCKKMDEGVMFPSDNRGKNNGNRAGLVSLPPEIFNQIKNHIHSIVHTHRLKDFIRVDKVTGLEVNLSQMWKDYLKTYDPEHDLQNKGKKPDRLQTNVENVQSASNSTTTTQFQNVLYTNNTVTLSDSYYTPTIITQTQPHYPQQHVQYITINPETVINYPIATAGNGTPNAIVLKPELKEDNVKDKCVTKPDKKKGPDVKLWRYNNVFRSEITGSTYAAIKSRLSLYYLEPAKSSKKKMQSTTVAN